MTGLPTLLRRLAIYNTFKTRAEAVSAEVHRFPTRATALDFVLQILRSEGVGNGQQASAVWADSAFLATGNQEELAKIPGLSFEVTREKAAAARVGISRLDWAVANTGTLVQDAAPVERRLASTLPNIHIALVSTANLVPDMTAVFSRIQPQQTNYISMITGPSRTADIERVLTIGVHGPERLIIVFVDEDGMA